MKALLYLVFGAVLCVQSASAQSLSPSVVSSSGSFYQNGTGILSTTIGEMTMVETFSSGSLILTQGFQQPFDFSVGIVQPAGNNFFSIFPNPSSGNITISLPAKFHDDFEVNVFDAIGKLVFKKMVYADPLSKNIHLSMENLIEGMYVFEMKTKTEQCFKKINIIR